MADFLNRINWHSDDGVFFPMLMDFARNQYYDTVIGSSVSGRHCIDVGFGTGMLTMLALRHGASHITAYEADHTRYQLGQLIIESLGLDNVELINAEFDWSTPVDSNAVIVSETVGTQLWSEGLWHTMSRTQRQTWVPGEVFMQVIAEPVSQAFADDLFRPAEHWQFFNPGVDVDMRWVELINHLVKKQRPRRDRAYVTDNNQTTVWGGWTYAAWAKTNRSVSAQYQVNLGNQTMVINDATGNRSQAIDFDLDNLSLTIAMPNSGQLPVLIVPRVGFCHTTDRGPVALYLDQATSWGGGCQPLLVTEPCQYVTIKHSVHSGLITYSKE